MKLVTFFFALWLYLPGGYNSAQATSSACKIFNSSFRDNKKLQQPESASAGCQHITTSSESLGDDNEFFVVVEDDDEEDNIRKHIVPVRHFLALYYTFFSTHPCINLLEPIFFSGDMPHPNPSKYILQRVLRI